MMNIELTIFPGGGEPRYKQIAEGSTVSDFVDQFNLQGRNILVNGVSISPDEYTSVQLTDEDEVLAGQPTKGA